VVSRVICDLLILIWMLVRIGSVLLWLVVVVICVMVRVNMLLVMVFEDFGIVGRVG